MQSQHEAGPNGRPVFPKYSHYTSRICCLILEQWAQQYCMICVSYVGRKKEEKDSLLLCFAPKTKQLYEDFISNLF